MTELDKLLVKILKQEGYDGLCNPDIECGCHVSDFRPCNSDPSECVPGYARWAALNSDFSMTTEKPKIATSTDTSREAPPQTLDE